MSARACPSPGPAKPSGLPPQAWLTLLVLVVFYVLNALDRTLLSLMVGPAKHDLGVGDAEMGLLLGLAFALLYAVAGVPLGVLVDRCSRRLVLFAGVAFWSLAALACGLARTFPELALARMGLGVGEASLMPAAHALLADRFPPQRLNLAMSIFYVSGVVGNSLSIGLGGLMVQHFARFPAVTLWTISTRGWQVPFVLVGGVGLVAASLAFSFREPPRHRRLATADSGSAAGFLRQRRGLMMSILGSYVLFAMLMYGVILWSPAYLERTFHWPRARIGLSLAILNLISAGTGTLAGGWVADRLLRRSRDDAYFLTFAGGLLIAVPAGVAAFSVSGPVLFLLLLGTLFFFGFSYSGYAAATVQAIAPAEARGRYAATYLLLLVLVGNGLGPWLIGLLSDAFAGTDGLGIAIRAMLLVVGPVAILAALLGRTALAAAVAARRAAQDSLVNPRGTA